MSSIRSYLLISHLGLVCLAFSIFRIFQVDMGTIDMDSVSSPNQQSSCVNYDKSSPLFVHEHHHNYEKHMIDKASITVIVNSTEKGLQLCAQSSECWDCPLMHIMEIGSDHNGTLKVDTRFPVQLSVFKKNGLSSVCSVSANLEQYNEYDLWINSDEDISPGECVLATCETAADSNLPVYIALSVLLGIEVLWLFLMFLYRKGYFRRWNFIPTGDTETLINSDLGTPSHHPANSEALLVTPVPKSVGFRERLRSLDAFRGLSLMVMVFVNYRGGWYWYFRHSAWNGLTVADLVFPWFVFIMGTSMALSFRSLLKKGVTRKKLLLKSIKRAVILFALGLLISNRGKLGKAANLTDLRIPGVLQRLAVCYLVVSVMECFFAKADDVYETRRWATFRDILPFWPEWLIASGIIALHTVLTFYLNIPDCEKGYLGPGGLHSYSENGNQSNVNCTGGAAGYIDRQLFGENHIYQHPTSTDMYLSYMPFDPEGALGTLNAIFLCFLGLQAGKILIYHRGWKARITRWICWGVVTGTVAGILCRFSQNDGWIPVNKNLWSLSYSLALSAMAFFLLTIFYLVIDVLHIWSGAPYFYPGMNSILIYMCHEILNGYFPVQFSVAKTHYAQLAMSLYGAILWTIVAVVLYRKKVFLSI